MTRKRSSILQRDATRDSGSPHKRRRTADAPTALHRKRDKPPQQQQQWTCRSVVDRQAVFAVSRLLRSDETARGGVAVKALTLAAQNVAKAATHAVTCETLKHITVLDKLLQATDMLQQYPQLSRAVGLVLLYELLFGEGLPRAGPAERAVLSREGQLRGELRALLQAAGATDVSQLLPCSVQGTTVLRRPRTARVNTLKASVGEVMHWLRERGQAEGVSVDPLLPDVLCWPPGHDLHAHPLVQRRVLMLQGRSSCMSAHALAPRRGWHVVDCCAAPGNKTTHVAALLEGSGRVFAFDKDPRRLNQLKANVAAAGADNVEAQLADFLSIDPDDACYSNVSGLLLDPSCSGSGTHYSRGDYLLPSFQRQQQAEGAQEWAGGATAAAREVEAAARNEGEAVLPSGADGSAAAAGGSVDAARVEALARFQEAALRHALRFPRLRRLVYSTCSVHSRENEGVVAAVLPQAAAAGFELQDPFPSWHRRGLPTVEGWQQLVRVDPEEDLTDGFFVALFVRRGKAGRLKSGGIRHAQC